MRRVLLIILVVLIALPLAGLGAAYALLNSDWLRSRAEASVQQATGRTLTIKGKVRLAWSLTPAIEADDVSLANPPGMSRPDMVHFARVQAQLGLLRPAVPPGRAAASGADRPGPAARTAARMGGQTGISRVPRRRPRQLRQRPAPAPASNSRSARLTSRTRRSLGAAAASQCRSPPRICLMRRAPAASADS